VAFSTVHWNADACGALAPWHSVNSAVNELVLMSISGTACSAWIVM
jgi:hypothetical protein